MIELTLLYCKNSMAAVIELLVVVLVVFLNAVVVVESVTDSSDVQALGVLYSSLNNPSKLSGWSASGGDPCGSSWKGITCSGSSVTSLQLSGLGLNGTLGYLLGNFLSLKIMDLSNNNIHDSIPYQLPPNITNLNLASNNISGSIPYSLTTLVNLNYLDVSHNVISQTIIDVFTNLQSLSELDFSFNNLSGNLPNSFQSLSNLSRLYLQNNQLSGAVNVLANLGLKTLNISNNNFSGWIPKEFSSIPNLILGGNSFSNSPAPPPPPFAPPPPNRPRDNSGSNTKSSGSPRGSNGSNSSDQDQEKNNNSLSKSSVIGIAVGSSVAASLIIVVVMILCLQKVRNKKFDGRKNRSESERSSPVVANTVFNKDVQEQTLKALSTRSLKPTITDKLIAEKEYEKAGSGKWPKSPISATSYTVATLQVATHSFSQDCLVGAGSLGRVYKAEFSNGKVLAIKKIDSAMVSVREDDNFLQTVSSLSRLRHPNIVQLVGYCSEHGQRLLVYEYIGNGSLYDMLHFIDDRSKALSWNARVRVALGTARALEYLHEICLPSIVHRNFKSVNILLDEDVNSHLSDCGLTALTLNMERQVSSEVVDSFGYSAPEFAMSGVYTVKSDVYSFGVVMLELLTGRKPLDSSRVRSEQSLIRWAMPQLHDIDALAKMVDPALNGMYPAKSLSRFADIISLCIQPEPEFRPPMSEVVQQLVRLVQRSSIIRRGSTDEIGSSYRVFEQEFSTADISF